MSNANKVPCPACGGSALSPYPDDGGSCPHCFNGEVEAVEQMRAADVLPCGHTKDHESMLLETGEFVCDQCGAIHR